MTKQEAISELQSRIDLIKIWNDEDLDRVLQKYKQALVMGVKALEKEIENET